MGVTQAIAMADGPEDDRAEATALLYIRVSSSGQVKKGVDPEGYSIPGQREVATQKADRLSAAVVGEYVEYGVSGRTTARPALQRLLADIKTVRPTYVIVYDLSRLARNRADDALLMLEIEASGARLVSCLENIDQTPAGRLTHGVLAAVNEFRSAGDAEKVKMGLRRKHSMGGTNGKAPIGYLNVQKRIMGRDSRTVEVDPERAELVRLAFEAYATGDYSVTAIMDMLDASGLRTPMTPKRPPKPLCRSAVHRMLSDDYYIGVVTYEGAKNPNGLHTPLIDKETFERVQMLLEMRALSGDRSQKHQHYLRGSLYCGRCGGRMLYSPVKGNGGRYIYYVCRGGRRAGLTCGARSLPLKLLEEAVERYYRRSVRFSRDEQARVRSAVQKHVNAKRAVAAREADRAERRLADLKSEQTRLLQLSYQGLVDDEVLAAEQTRIKGERDQLDRWVRAATHDIAEIEEALEEALALLDRPGEAYAAAPPMVRRMMNQALFEQIQLLDGDVTDATFVPWAEAIVAVGRPKRARASTRQEDGQGLLGVVDGLKRGAKNHQDPRSLGGPGLYFSQMVRSRGLEPPRGYPPQGPQPCASTNSATTAWGRAV